ncbi:MAG: hypothetical protein IKR08_07450 [Firmicutes bacterium]|nr:hypothetical protein [Bacillota bacterium]
MIYALELVLYTGWFAGLFLVFRKELGVLGNSVRLRHRLAASRRAGGENRALRWLADLLSAAFGRELAPGPFAAGIAGIFIIVLISGLRSVNAAGALFTAAAFAAAPILFLYLRVERGRSRGSREAVSFVTDLYREYRISGCSMLTAMEKCAAMRSGYPICRRQLLLLLLRLREAASPREIRSACSSFAFAIDTTWSYMLSVCIRMAVEKGTDVSEGLADMLRQLRVAESRAEARKRLNSESVRITVFLVPLLYIGTALISVYYLGVDAKVLLHDQFATPDGFVFFTAIALLFVINLILTGVVSDIKLDY